jgi:uncharacterized tellurite resistance protein B-like protein
MNLFEDTGSGSSSALSPAEAYAGILVVAVAADGKLKEEELAGFLPRLERMRMFQGWDDDRIRATVNRVLRRALDEGLAKFAGRCAAALPEELVLTAFANVCDLVCADGVIDTNEQAYVNDLFQNLNVKAENARTILKVMMIKNRR